MSEYLHEHPEFNDLIRIIADEKQIKPILVEKDYWIMHCLYGLHQQGFRFYLKGGTSLSKGHKIIHRFSEDLDVLIEPPSELKVAIGRNQDKPQHRESRKRYYDWLKNQIQIPGIIRVERDYAFDDEQKYRSGGIRLFYPTSFSDKDIKDGILLEVGFDTISPNEPMTISSWAYDFGAKKVVVIDNRAIDVLCYHPGYTFVEKLQTVSTKFRKQQSEGKFSENFMRHYYDIYHLLGYEKVQSFIGTNEYKEHKAVRFRAGDNPNISENEAFKLSAPEVFEQYEGQYALNKTLYYKDKPTLSEIIQRIQDWVERL